MYVTLNVGMQGVNVSTSLKSRFRRASNESAEGPPARVCFFGDGRHDGNGKVNEAPVSYHSTLDPDATSPST